MATILYSQEGKYRAIVREIPNREDDGFWYKVDVTGEEFDSQRKAILNARSWLKKKRQEYYKSNSKKWVKRVRGNSTKRESKLHPFKTLHKLYKMDKEVAILLVQHSGRKLKLQKDYAEKNWGKKVTAVTGEPKHFSLAIASLMKKGNKSERKAVAKMIKKFENKPFNKTHIFY